MAKTSAKDPNCCVHDNFREKDMGVVSLPANSKPATSNFYVDRSRLGVHDEYDPQVKNEWGGRGKWGPAPNRIVDNAREMQMAGGARSSFTSINPREPTGNECCAPSSMYSRRRSQQVRGGE
jgi:hypothetical protein